MVIKKEFISVLDNELIDKLTPCSVLPHTPIPNHCLKIEKLRAILGEETPVILHNKIANFNKPIYLGNEGNPDSCVRLNDLQQHLGSDIS